MNPLYPGKRSPKGTSEPINTISKADKGGATGRH